MSATPPRKSGLDLQVDLKVCNVDVAVDPAKKMTRLVLAFTLLTSAAADAGPVTFLTALPVAQSQAVVRGQYLLIRATADPETAGRLTVHAIPLSVAVGLTPRLAIFGIVPIMNKSFAVNTPQGRLTREAAGVGDVVTFVRYTAYAMDRADDTLRIAPFGGVKSPTGDHVGRDGILHVADSGNRRVVMLSADGEFVTDWRLPNPDSNVYSPEHVAVSADGSTIYATDLAGNRVLVLAVTPPHP